jgi:hypothetical protein
MLTAQEITEGVTQLENEYGSDVEVIEALGQDFEVIIEGLGNTDTLGLAKGTPMLELFGTAFVFGFYFGKVTQHDEFSLN